MSQWTGTALVQVIAWRRTGGGGGLRIFANRHSYAVYAAFYNTTLFAQKYFQQAPHSLPELLPAGKHLIPKTSSRQRFQDVQNVNAEDVHKN